MSHNTMSTVRVPKQYAQLNKQKMQAKVNKIQNTNHEKNWQPK